MAYEDEENALIENMIEEDSIVGPGDAVPPPPPNWRDSVPTLTNMPQYKGKPNVLFADEETGDLVRYGTQGEEIERTEGQIPIKAKPPGKRPSDLDLTEMEFLKLAGPDIEKEAEDYAASVASDYEKSVPYSTRANMKDGVFEMKKADLIARAKNEKRNELVGSLSYEFRKKQTIEQEKIRNARELAEKTPTDIELTTRALTEKLGRTPTAQEIIDAKQKREIDVASAKAVAATEAKGIFKSWTPEAKEQEFMLHAITGKPPVSAAGLGGSDRQQYGKEYAQWKANKGIRPQDIALMQADYKAGDMSLRNMSKQEAPMEAFVGNINKQIAEVERLYSNNDRIGLRLLDLPIRELKMRAGGSGAEAVKASYLLEISNEIGKLSSGASASVQQLSDSAKEDWKKVHDPNLSLKEIMKVVNATRDQANMRMQSWRDAKETVRNNLRFIGSDSEKRIEQPKGERTVVERRRTKSGKILTKYSDGSIE